MPSAMPARCWRCCEANTGYEMALDLATVGEWCPGTDAPLELGAHNRRHPRTGAMFAITYAVDRPLVRVHQVDAAGRLVRTFPVELACRR
jgi:carotenoid cleavage dioxygenase-like enzyme